MLFRSFSGFICFPVTIGRLNTLNPEIQNGLKAGQKILIPVVKKVVPEQNSTTQTKAEEKTQTKPESTNNQEFITHTVKKRQTLFAISRIYGVSQDELRELNPEIQNGLKADMILKIPVKNKESKKNDEKAEKNDKKTERVEKKSNKNNLTDSVTFISHKVKSKETLYSISRQYGVSVDEIKKHNPITQTYLREGSNLKIPIKKEKTESETIVKVSQYDLEDLLVVFKDYRSYLEVGYKKWISNCRHMLGRACSAGLVS